MTNGREIAWGHFLQANYAQITSIRLQSLLSGHRITLPKNDRRAFVCDSELGTVHNCGHDPIISRDVLAWISELGQSFGAYDLLTHRQFVIPIIRSVATSNMPADGAAISGRVLALPDDVGSLKHPKPRLVTIAVP